MDTEQRINEYSFKMKLKGLYAVESLLVVVICLLSIWWSVKSREQIFIVNIVVGLTAFIFSVIGACFMRESLKAKKRVIAYQSGDLYGIVEAELSRAMGEE